MERQGLETTIGGMVKLFVDNPDGSVAYESQWIKNLILDQGLDRLASVYYADLFKYCAVGTGIQITQRTGAVGGNTAVTASMTLGSATITASAAAFEAADVGRLIRWTSGADSGKEFRIASYTDSTHVEATTIALEIISSGTFKVFYVNQTGLTTEANRTDTVSGNVAENGTTTAATAPFAKTLKRTFLFPAETAPITYKEIGFSNLGAVGSNLNIRINLNPSNNISVLLNQRLRVTYSFSITPTPSAITAGSVPITDLNLLSLDKSGSYVIEKFATSAVNSQGLTDTTTPELEPAYEGFMGFSSNTEALVPIVGSSQRTTNVSYVPLTFLSAYTNGTFYRDFQGVFDLNDANRSDLKSLMLFDPTGGYSIFCFLFTTVQAKDQNHSLNVVWRKTWNHDFSGL